jgi:hypothetical protein
MWDKEFFKACESSSNAQISRLPDTLQLTLKFLSNLPDKINLTFMITEHFEKLFKADTRTAMIVYWEEIDERIKFVWQSMGLKGYSLLCNMVDCINSKNYYPALVLLRALLENVAVLRYCSRKIAPLYAKVIKEDLLGKMVRGKLGHTVVLSKELEDLLINYSHGTTLKELTRFQKKWQAKRISEYIDFLSQDKSYSLISEHYSFLCQVAHPSIGSTLVFYNNGHVVDKKEVHDYSRDQDLVFFLKSSAFPLNVCCDVLLQDIEELQETRFTG